MLYKDIVISLYVVFVQRAASSQLAQIYFTLPLTYSILRRLLVGLSCGFVFVVLSIPPQHPNVNTFLLAYTKRLQFGVLRHLHRLPP